MLRFLALSAVAVCLAACATPSKPMPALSRLEALGVDSRTYTKIVNHRVLNYGDIMDLVKKHVPNSAIVSYLKSTHAPYAFTDTQLQNLVAAGAKAELVNYLGQSVGFFEAAERSQTGGAGKWKKHPYFADPYYMGDAPFMYGYPPDWYGMW